MKKLLAQAIAVAALCPSVALAADPGDGWFAQTRFLGGISSAPGSFATLPPGATGGNQTSYQPQEYFGTSAGLGYQFSAWGVPFRAVLDGSVNFRHDTDVASVPAVTALYKGNLRTVDLRVSLLADVLNFGWGRFYAGVGLGAAEVHTDVEFKHTPVLVTSDTWKASPSVEVGIAFTGFSKRVIPQIGYRWRWVGDVESGTFADGSKVRFKDFNIHDIMFGFTVPLQDTSASPMIVADPTPMVVEDEAFWTGFHVGAFGGWGKAEDFNATSVTVPATSYDFAADGATGGAEIGVDWQWRWFVLGLSGEAGMLNIEGSGTDPNNGAKTSFSSDWYGSFSVRGGLAYDNFYAYGRVGAYYLNAEAKTTPPSAREEDVIFGWYLGAGLEYAMTRHWSVGGEYRFVHPNDDLQPESGADSQNVSLHPIHMARASVNYRW